MMKNNYYFIGIKGTGMASLAILLKELGNNVTGSDISKHFFTEDELKKFDIEYTTFEEAKIEDNSIVIIGNAFLDDFFLVKKAYENKTLKCYRYHTFLGEFIKNYKSVCIAGSHGKTTTTGILASVLNEKYDAAYLIGDGTGRIDENSEYFILEADEFRRHFIAYYPDYAIITNIDLDHVDYFKDETDYVNAYLEFIDNVSKKVVICGDDKNAKKLEKTDKLLFYGLDANNDATAKNIVETTTTTSFDYYLNNKFLYRFNLNIVGNHLLLNCLGVISVSILEGLDYKEIEEGINKFRGVKRRFVVEESNGYIYIDDYAHHPTEVKVTIEAAKKRYPDKNLVAIFKPHRVSRLYKFVDEFAAALKIADEVYLCDFTSIDDKEEGINIDINYLKDRIPNAKVIKENEDGAKELKDKTNSVYLFMSSKDIYGLEELLKRFHKS